ncbi:MAG TPA: XdhC family protein [Steroidobacteraceae bacterium]|nr:XdhC family protein [Steroidobacteraceae bacterium]
MGPLLPLFARERAAGRALALGLLLHTAGSTYRKPGALILIAAGGEYAGLISGGCLEGDLREHARKVIETGAPTFVRYDLRSPDELLFGLGLGCEGAMEILLLYTGPKNAWQPLAHLAEALTAHTATAIGVITESTKPEAPIGTLALPPGAARTSVLAIPAVESALARAASERRVGWVEGEEGTWKLFVLPLALPPRILLLGAGPDAVPLVDLAARLGWKVTLVDHRPAYAVASHFPAAASVILARAPELDRALALDDFAAAVVMSHHLPSDLAYLRALAASAIPYVGLLGPAVRRDRLLGELGADAQRLRRRLHAPVGLPLGGRTPEAIALAIAAEIHAFLHGAAGSGVLETALTSVAK